MAGKSEKSFGANKPMMENQASDSAADEAAKISQAMSEIAERSQTIVRDFLAHQANGDGMTDVDPLNIGSAFLEMTTRLMTNPAQLVEAQIGLWHEYMALWQNTARRMMGEEVEPVVTPDMSDRRFRDEAWEENQLFDFIKQSYLLSARWLQKTVGQVEGLDDKTSQKIDFYTRQFVDALAPSNFVITNPEVLRATLETRGENLVKGLQNLLDDLERGKGKLRIRMTDTEAFEPGHNIAVTKGSVVFQNELMQLIQYDPTTEKAFKRPLLIVPPWINKYYILDLREKNSFIKWAVDSGFTVFVISWVNPDAALAGKTFEDYLSDGPFAALEAIEAATGEREVNAVGYCLGGTLLACALAYMAAKDDGRIKSGTFLTTMTDFDDPGELGVFIDEAQLQALEKKMNERGYLEGAEMATTFNMLRANDLIWSFVVNNYLLGKDPFPFDLLYWNSDSTRMPATMHSFYLRNLYQENLLREPGGITLLGEPIDLGKIKLPICLVSAREDHIAPWQATYSLTRLVSGPSKFILAASGHIAGIVNPPAANKYCYWTSARNARKPDTWLRNAEQHEGSWWPEWARWVKRKSGAKVAARKPGNGKLKVIEAAPGSYVKVKAEG
jgi:polyhydroxyalkanoate synthase